MKNSDIFHISAQNIDCGYLLEPPRWGGSNEYPTIYVFKQSMQGLRNTLYTHSPESINAFEDAHKEEMPL